MAPTSIPEYCRFDCIHGTLLSKQPRYGRRKITHLFDAVRPDYIAEVLRATSSHTPHLIYLA